MAYIDKISPQGWHLPTKTETETLIQNLTTGEEFNIHQLGIRLPDGNFVTPKEDLNVWTATDSNEETSYNLALANLFYVEANDKNCGFIVRLIKDDPTSYVSGDTLDYLGIRYRLQKIGDQVWMIDNLRCNYYNDGSPIPNLITNQAWAQDTEGGYCYFDNNPANI